jgi:hypothetical protein
MISLGPKPEIRVMGLIRPPGQLPEQQSTKENQADDEVDAEEASLDVVADIQTAQAFLDQSA